jgi:ribosomal protein S18 acetylase RimI-like enzyme
MLEIRVLGAGDEARLDAFLARHASSSMFLRSNLRAAGIVDHGRTYQATYAAALFEDQVVAVSAHAWNGVLLLQAPRSLETVARLAIDRTGRRVAGLAGPWPQVVAARAAVGLAGAPARMESREDLFDLDLDRLVVPAPLAADGGELVCRPPRDGEIGLLATWRARFHVEVLGAADDLRLRQATRIEIEASVREEKAFVLLDRGQPAAFSGFNARLPDAVQVGGVYTPPQLRGRGYARAAVAGSLVAARAAGAARATLFTGVDNLAARKAYLALGFVITGDYGLVLFR